MCVYISTKNADVYFFFFFQYAIRGMFPPLLYILDGFYGGEFNIALYGFVCPSSFRPVNRALMLDTVPRVVDKKSPAWWIKCKYASIFQLVTGKHRDVGHILIANGEYLRKTYTSSSPKLQTRFLLIKQLNLVLQSGGSGGICTISN